MKMRNFSQDRCGESAIRPGFDVLMAVTGARQAASSTARRVATTRCDGFSADSTDQRRALLARGRTETDVNTPPLARFADIAPISGNPGEPVETLATEINGLFTRAFQSIVKHPPVKGLDKAGNLGGTGSGMK